MIAVQRLEANDAVEGAARKKKPELTLVRILPTIGLTELEVAKALGVSESTVKRYVLPELPRFYVGSMPRYRPEDVLAWAADRATPLP
jgi:hypothetical protein